MRRLREYLFVRHRHNWVLLLRFGLVGVSGVFVNMLTLIVVKRLGPPFDQAIVGVPGTEFNVRWYHVYSTIAFLVANLWNFQLNRSWTFRSDHHAPWWREYWPFLTVGLLGQVVGLGLLTLLMHPDSALALPTSLLDDSTGLRTRLYWAQLIVIAVVTPLSFVLNKLWTFAAVRTHHPDLADPVHADEMLAEVDDEPVPGATVGSSSDALPIGGVEPGGDRGSDR
ncbi:polysaccharide synthesis protein GtrA [Intrasporangium oryzae NRRL B-24470]|uniref:Polysaccharide synthesis protein GtrA n=1 Tax=Intrasporangium oryzae NRRL B-24470 TaxID=1386089 RepID=W9G526_9MICO|nr:GtrA family protein [Intrasporangium oryzae]EWT01110.1 polysaccharide synthesis protein GtrA [Intrasporangium oryzae NRRL B-24470]